MESGTLYGALATREQIAAVITPPAQGPRHKPVPHIDAINCIEQALDDMGWGIDRERFNLAGTNIGLDNKTYQNTSVYGMFNVSDRDPEAEVDGEMTTLLGFKSNNMMKHSLSFIAGKNMTICDNGIFSGEEIVGRKLHTINLNLLESLNFMFDAWLNSKSALTQQIEVMRNEPINDVSARAILFDLFNDNVLPLKNLRETAATYFAPENAWTDVIDNHGTLWGLHNAVTRVLRPMPIAKQMEYSGATTTALVAVAA